MIDNEQSVSILDRTNLSSRQALHVTASALRTAGVNVAELTLSATSIHKARKSGRESIGNEIEGDFQPGTPLIVHFDGKLLPGWEGQKFDRLTAVISGKNVEKLLGIPEDTSGYWSSHGSSRSGSHR